MTASVFPKRITTALLALTWLGCGTVESPTTDDLSVAQSALVTALPAPAVARSKHTLGLRGTSVYVVGGNPALSPSVEVLNTSTNTFSAGPSLLTNRRSHRMVTLADGTFVVFGGIDAANVIASGEKLAPGATAWQAIAPMPAAVYGHTATVLADGRVLVVGGVSYRTSAWLYDPAANTWTVTGSLALGRMFHSAVRLADGRVLVASGSSATGATATAELFNPATGTWVTTGSMPFASSNPSLALAGTRVLVVGEGTSVAQYDVASGTFVSAGPSVGAHTDGTLLGLADGSALLFGDWNKNLSIERLAPSPASWTVVDTQPAYREAAPALQLADGRVVVVGGVAFPVGGGNEFARADAFTWTFSGGGGTCTPRTCASAGATCGTLSDNCGGTLSCGTCGAGLTCGAANTCVAACVPRTCASIGATCGTIADTCGGTLSCGTCGTGLTCSANQCIAACTPRTCASAGVTCGTISDTCGGTLTCGPACNTTVAVFDATLRAPVCSVAVTVCAASTSGRGSVGPEANTPNTLQGTCVDGPGGSFHVDESVDAVRVRGISPVTLSAGGQAQVEVDVWAYSAFASDILDVYIATNPSAPVWSLVGSRNATKAGQQTIVLPLTLPTTTTGGRLAVRAQFRYGGTASPCVSGSFADRDDLVFAVAPPQSPTGLQNAGFESGLSGWTTTGTVSVDVTGGLSYQGTTHAVLRGQYGASASVSNTFLAPTALTGLSAAVRPESTNTISLTSNVRFRVTVNGLMVVDKAVISNLVAPGSWTVPSVAFTAPAGATVTVTVLNESTIISSGEFYRVDAVAVF